MQQKKTASLRGQESQGKGTILHRSECRKVGSFYWLRYALCVMNVKEYDARIQTPKRKQKDCVEDEEDGNSRSYEKERSKQQFMI